MLVMGGFALESVSLARLGVSVGAVVVGIALVDIVLLHSLLLCSVG